MSKLSVIFFLLMLAFTARSQQHSFSRFSIRQGLPDLPLTSMCEDTRGFLWIGTDGGGVYRYDGYTFKNFSVDDGLINNNVRHIYEDSNGTLWFGTTSGISQYDGTSIKNFPHLQSESISCIVQGASSEWWIATTSAGLFKYDGEAITPFRATGSASLPEEINTMYVDHQQKLWIGSSKGLYSYHGQKLEVISGIERDGGVVHISGNGSGTTWVVTNTAVMILDATTRERIPFAAGKIYTASIAEDDQIWLGTSHGIVRFTNKSFVPAAAFAGQSIPSVRCSLKDSWGNVWFGSEDQGLIRMSRERFLHFPENDEMGRKVYSLVQALNGNIMCGTSLGGATVFDGKQYTLLNKREGFTSSTVQTFFYTSDSSLWVGTQDDGIYHYSRSSFRKYTREDGLISNNITAFAEDNAGHLWIATADSGLFQAQVAGDSISFLQKLQKKDGLPTDQITSLLKDKFGDLWVGGHAGSVARISMQADAGELHLSHFDVSDVLSGNIVHSLLCDNDNRIFVGSMHGITILDQKGKTRITRADGLASNKVYAMVFDNGKNLWAGTDRGVDIISFGENAKFTIRHFDQENGFRGSEVFRNAILRDKNNSIWFGTVNGLVKYDPQEERSSAVLPKIYLEGINLFFDPIENTAFADSISGWFSVPLSLRLPYDQNNLTFNFVGIYPRNPEAVRYRWKLSGFQDDWSPPLKERQAIFSNLPPGQYTFKVSASNENNVWTSPVEYTFIIAAPYWQQIWFRASISVAALALVWLLFSVRLSRVKARNRIVQERLEMEKNILELEQEASRLQMNPHFIFNCLNSIQGYISTGENLEAKKYLSKFGKLMRLILENAREEFIPLENEIALLNEYLELERLTTQRKFEFRLTVAEGVNTSAIQIPPMMIQPFVENAIIHGIKKKDGDGLIEVHFKVMDGLLVCEVIDNGIGRLKAQQLNGKPGHRSSAIRITTERLAQYSKHRKVSAGINFIDLENNGVAAGTRVVITTPFET